MAHQQRDGRMPLHSDVIDKQVTQPPDSVPVVRVERQSQNRDLCVIQANHFAETA